MRIRRVPTTEYVECAQAGPELGHPCTLPENHFGHHLACDQDGNELEEWPP